MSKTPLRISFFGGGTDISPFPEEHGGAVLCSTIDKFAFAKTVPLKKNSVRLSAVDLNMSEVLKTKAKFFDITYGNGPDLLKAMLKILKPSKKKFEITTWCDVPPGTGLGASSAIMISQISSLCKYLGKSLTSYHLAQLAFKIEREELAIKGGLQDQYACTFGGFNFIEFGKKSVTVLPIRISNEILNELSSSLLLFDTQVSRSSSKIIKNQIKNYSSDKVVEVLIKMKKMVYEARNLLIKGNLLEFAKILDESWNLKKTIEETISTSRINKIYSHAMKSGCIGGKILGAGGGGHLLLFCEPLKRNKIKLKMESLGCKHIPFSFFKNGTETWVMNKGTVQF